MSPKKRQLESVDIYLKEIDKTPLLRRAEEVEVARKARLGDLAAREHLVKANLRFVVMVAKEYRGHGIPLGELISFGHDGIEEAAKRFDERRGNKFISYAVHWIRQRIELYGIARERTVHLPMHRLDLIKRIGKVENRLAHRLERWPTVDEVVAAMPRTSRNIARRYFRYPKTVLSLDEPLYGNQENGSRSSMLPDPKSAGGNGTPWRRMKIAKDLRAALATLTPFEAYVIENRFCLEGTERTLKEIGEIYGNRARQSVHQTERKALRKLRPRVKHLKELL